MSGATGSLCAAAVAGALLTAALPPVGLCAPGNFSGGPEALVHKAVYAYELYGPDDIPFYDEENYCWQQVFTPSNGWVWVDVCHGYAF
jgi:hypothetical protein